MSLQRTAGKGTPRPELCSPLYSLCFLTALQPKPKTVAASGQSLSQHCSCRDNDTRARGSQSQRRIATDNVPNFLSFLTFQIGLIKSERAQDGALFYVDKPKQMSVI
ncbi:hypothetical protein TYRP_009989, partial [Tyrophagus putrescentiae]